jgi:hypothetical protein
VVSADSARALPSAAPGANRSRAIVPRRIALGIAAFLGTAIYVASVMRLENDELSRFALRLGLSAAISWVIFGGILCLVVRRVRPIEWADVCLGAMGIGVLLLIACAAMNLGLTPHLQPPGKIEEARQFQVIGLFCADVSMGAWFVTRSARKGIPASTALWAWVFGLNGVFALLMISLP